ncbi:MAG TPA: glycosyltransferase family A protein [Candidatus Sulfotelmatobacter sp.]|nr:glycosyltransferase family A protein [Candidatus Sulfotelmatobacter sp.]
MKISIVIPVYNEEDTLRECLEAVALLRPRADEVIVVDNNSTDETYEIASSFDFVKLLREDRQGVVYARTAGFDASKGDIIARIDADTLLPKDWVKQVRAVFKDDRLMAASGKAQYYGASLAHVFNAVDLYFRRSLSRQLDGRLYLWGANMAIKREAWERVKDSLCYQKDIHEDYDVAIHLQRLNMRVAFDERLVAQVSSRRIDMNFLGFMAYVWKSPSTYAKHKESVYRAMMPIVITCAIGYLPARVLYRGYDPVKDSFSFTKLLSQSDKLTRVDPTVNVA